MVSGALGGNDWTTVVLRVVLGISRNHFKFEKKSKGEREEEVPCRRNVGVSTGRQGVF